MQPIIDALKLALTQNYVNFSGRANRPEYWYFILAYFLISFIAGFICAFLPDVLGAIIRGILALGFFLPIIAAGIRRLHDTDKSGWFMLIGIIPLVGLFLLYLLAQPGTEGSNQYGEPSNNLR